jgi:hypothetical protein
MSINLNDEDQCFCADCCSQGHCSCEKCNEPCTCESIDPTCDMCGISSEDAPEWCGDCGNCKAHCAGFVDCASSIEGVLFEKIIWHIGHELEAVTYRYEDGEPLNAAIECVECGVVLVDEDNPNTQK